jgi:PST family polysaccharide transporter
MMNVVNTILSGILFYLLRILLFHRLAVEDYGLFYSVMSLGMIVYPFLAMGFDPGIVPHLAKLREKGDDEGLRSAMLGVLILQSILAMVAAGIMFFAADTLAQGLFGNARAAVPIKFIAVYVLAVVLFKIGINFLLALQHIAMRNCVEVVRVVACVAVAYALVQGEGGMVQAAYAYGASTGGAACVAFLAILVLQYKRLSGPTPWRPHALGPVFNVGKYASFAFGGILIFSHMDTVMLTTIRADNEAAAAAYQIAVPTMMILYALLYAGANHFMPMVATMNERGETAELAGGIQRIYESAVVFVLPATVLLACYSDVIMETLFRRDILDAPDAFNILALGGLFTFVAYFNLHVLVGLGQSKKAAAAVAAALVANVILNVALIYILNIRGAALATVLSNALATVLTLGALRRILPLALPLKSFIGALALSLALGATARALRSSDLFTHYPVAVGAISSVAFFALGLVALEWLGLARLRGMISLILSRERPHEKKDDG